MTVVNISGIFFDGPSYFNREPRLTNQEGNEYAWQYLPGKKPFEEKPDHGVYRWKAICQVDPKDLYYRGKIVDIHDLEGWTCDPIGQTYLSVR